MDGFKEYNDAWDTMLGLKQLSSDDVQRMVKKPLGQFWYSI